MYPQAQIQREGTFDSKKIRCVLVHDHVWLRQGLRRLLEDERDMEVVAEAGDPAEALQIVFEHRPEVVITDARVFECAPEVTERLILQGSPRSTVLFLTIHETMREGESVPLEMQGTRTSCAVRQTSGEELIEMVRMAHAGGRAMVREMPRADRGDAAPGGVLSRKRVLTSREREVLKLLAEGKTVRSVADVLGLSAKTVDAHKFNLMRKLGIHNKAELVMWAIQKKIVKVPANF